MTHPIDPTPEPNESAAQYRVSAQELSHVVGIIQARKEAEARQRANTVALGEAVEQLGLEMTPDELLAEIQADRARRSGGSGAARPKRQNPTQRRTVATFAVCAGLAAMMVSSIHMHNMRRAMWESRNSSFFAPHEYVYETTPTPMQTEVVQTMDEPTQAMATPSVEVTTSVGMFSPFSQFGENALADAEFDSVQELANGKSESEILARPNGIFEDRLWTLVKQNGEVMVYTFGTSDEIAKAMNGRTAHVFASPHEGLDEELLPLRLFKNSEQVDTPGRSGALLNLATVPGAQVYYYMIDSADTDTVYFPRNIIVTAPNK
ncbi:MAG: hypothetical protein JWN14_4335 [Chthonomonadales bacterium]|nr:hypothetical protein [Chthonomonadales bacterium]